MADKKPSTIFGGLLGNADLKIKKRKSRTDEAIDDMSEGREAKRVPLYEDELTVKKKPKKK